MCSKWKMKRVVVPALCALLAGSALLSSAAGARDAKSGTPEYGTEDTSGYEVMTNRHTQYAAPKEAVCLLATEGFEEKLNNGTLSVWYSEDTEGLRIVDLRSGYVWGCIDDREEYGLNNRWTDRASSMLYITYFNLEGTQESCALSENTFDAKYQWGEDGFTCQVSARRLGISFSFAVSIEEDRLTFAMEDESIEETGKSKLAGVSFLSFLGTVYEDTVPGYVLVPDGSGALIRFQKAKAYQSGYSRKVYGNDLAIDRDTTLSNLNGNRTDDYATEENRLSLPVWGMVHGEGQNGFLASVEGGELYTVINAIPAGAENQTVRFTRAYADFIYRSQYDKRVSNSRTVTMPQEELNTVNPVLTYTFLTGEEADYSGMAREYRAQLLSRGLLPEQEPETEGEIPLLLQTAGSEVRDGFLFNGLQVLTTADQAQAMLDTLEEGGISNVSLLLLGWNEGGYHGAAYGETDFEKEVGTRGEIEALRDRVEENGGSFALAANPVTANEDQIRISRDAALNATLDTVMETVPNPGLMYPDTYYLRHTRITETLSKTFAELEDFDLLLEGMGSYLYSDYTIDDELTRLGVQGELLATVERAEQELWLDGTNLYLLPYASVLTDVPVTGSQYIYETDSVPFLQMVLRGSVDYYAPSANQGFYDNASILKMIEYGACPSFLVMGADNFSLNDTPMENYFSLNFEDWEERIYEVYGKVNEALENVKGVAISSHHVEAEGVSRTAYDNGARIYVNYNGEDYVTEDGLTVPAGGYAVEGQP